MVVVIDDVYSCMVLYPPLCSYKSHCHMSSKVGGGNARKEPKGIMEALMAIPTLGLKDAAMFLMCYPLISLFSVATSTWLVLLSNGITVVSHIVDVVKEWSISRKFKVQTQRGRERVEGLVVQVLLALRTFVVVLVLMVFKFTGMALFISVSSVFKALFQKDDSTVGRGIRSVLNGVSTALVGRAVFDGNALGGMFGDQTRKPSVQDSSKDRTSSLKKQDGSAGARCEVVDEGAHFNRTARGCLLPSQ